MNFAKLFAENQDLFKKGLKVLQSLDNQNQRALGGMSEREYAEKAHEAIHGDVLMFSGCQDSQTSADVGNTSSFGLPDSSGPGGAGGACTNAMLRALYDGHPETWIELLDQMQQYLKSRRYTQIPQLSASRKMNLNVPFEISGNYTGTHKALMIGINYVKHTQGRLNGCINDVISMKNYITRNQGFSEDPSTMRILIDNPNDVNARNHINIPVGHPGKNEILQSIEWLVDGVQAGDVLFLHYSGHGAQVHDRTGDEDDGKDETLVPEDYRSAGMINDDDLFKALVQRIPEGARLVCVMDCCHSGSILDLPYNFAATDENVHAVQTGQAAPVMVANPDFKAQIAKFAIRALGQAGFLDQFGGEQKVLGLASKFGFKF